MNRILVIRGGAIGDFILTLPALKALREAFPNARMEILGYKHIAALAENRYYVNAVRSIEYAALSGFFARDGRLEPELRASFASFDLVITYLFDPDDIFRTNLRRAGAGRIVCGPAQIQNNSHATRQLSLPVALLGIEQTDYVPKIFPSEEDRHFARQFLPEQPGSVFAVHIGSGSPQKNWPLDRWIDLGERLLGQSGSSVNSLLVVSGEADEPQRAILQERWRGSKVRFATNLPLPHLGAVLENCIFIGHDSGISHLAAAAGAKCILLFGPTDPAVWAPEGENVRVIRAPEGNLATLPIETVIGAVSSRNGGRQSAG